MLNKSTNKPGSYCEEGKFAGMNIETFLGIVGAFGGLEALKWLAGLRSSRRKAAGEAAECFENVVTKRVKTYEDSILFLQNQLQEKERQFADLSARHQESMQRELRLTEQLGEMKLRYRQSRCDRKDCDRRKPPLPWMKAVAKGTAAVLTAVLIVATPSCTRKIYVPVEHIKVVTDSVKHTALRVDTLIERDSVVLAVKGDTVTKEVWRYRERAVVRRDTVIMNREDRELEPRIVEVEKKRNGRRIIPLMALGALVVAALCALRKRK